MSKRKHLTDLERLEIEHGIKQGYSFPISGTRRNAINHLDYYRNCEGSRR